MKKAGLKLFVLFLSVLVLAGCGSKMDRDAKKMAKRVIEMEHIRDRRGDRSNIYGKPMTDQEYQQYLDEYIEYSSEMLGKYSETPEQKHEFYQLVQRKVDEMKGK